MLGKTIIGIDPGTNILGFGLIRITERAKIEFVDMGIVDLRKETDAYLKLAKIYREISVLCDRYKPTEMAIESPFYAKNPQVLFKLGRAQGAAILAGKERGLEIFEYAPRKAKVAVTGIGSASKEQVCNILEKTLNIKMESEYLDASDAMAIALCHYYQLSSPFYGNKEVSMPQRRGGVSWKEFLLSNPERIK